MLHGELFHFATKSSHVFWYITKIRTWGYFSYAHSRMKSVLRLVSTLQQVSVYRWSLSCLQFSYNYASLIQRMLWLRFPKRVWGHMIYFNIFISSASHSDYNGSFEFCWVESRSKPWINIIEPSFYTRLPTFLPKFWGGEVESYSYFFRQSYYYFMP